MTVMEMLRAVILKEAFIACVTVVTQEVGLSEIVEVHYISYFCSCWKFGT